MLKFNNNDMNKLFINGRETTKLYHNGRVIFGSDKQGSGDTRVYDFGDPYLNEWFDQNYSEGQRNLDFIHSLTNLIGFYWRNSKDPCLKVEFADLTEFTNLEGFEFSNNLICYSDNLRQLWMPPSIKSIGHWAFIINKNLHSCVFPSTFNSIGEQAIWNEQNKNGNGDGWHWLVFLSTTPPDLGGLISIDTIGIAGLDKGNGYYDALVDNDFKIYVPDEALQDYLNARNWSYYAEFIHPLSEFEDEERDLENIPPWWTEQYGKGK